MRFSDSLLLSWRLATGEARRGGSPELEPHTCSWGCAEATRLREAFANIEIDPTSLRRRIRALAGGSPDPLGRLVPEKAIGREAPSDGGSLVSVLDLLGALLEDPDPAVAQALAESGVLPDATAEVALAGGSPGQSRSVLDRFGRDLTALGLAGQLPLLVGRRSELRAR